MYFDLFSLSTFLNHSAFTLLFCGFLPLPALPLPSLFHLISKVLQYYFRHLLLRMFPDLILLSQLPVLCLGGRLSVLIVCFVLPPPLEWELIAAGNSVLLNYYFSITLSEFLLGVCWASMKQVTFLYSIQMRKMRFGTNISKKIVTVFIVETQEIFLNLSSQKIIFSPTYRVTIRAGQVSTLTLRNIICHLMKNAF